MTETIQDGISCELLNAIFKELHRQNEDGTGRDAGVDELLCLVYPDKEQTISEIARLIRYLERMEK